MYSLWINVSAKLKKKKQNLEFPKKRCLKLFKEYKIDSTFNSINCKFKYFNY